MISSQLLRILRDHIHSRQTAPFDTNWDSLLTLARNHEVIGIVYSQCKGFIPEPYLGVLQQSYGCTLFYHANRQNLISQIETALLNVEHFTIKGLSVAQYYPFPACRTMGDSDYVIHFEDKLKVDTILKSLGLQRTEIDDNLKLEWHYKRNDMVFEFHNNLVSSEAVEQKQYAVFFNDCWKYVHDNQLNWNFHFLFLILHLRKHLMNRGVGFRQFMDIAILCFRGPAFDWTWIEEELRRLDLWLFTERVFALNEYWFEVEPPLTISPISEGFLEIATKQISQNGVFGFENKNNDHNAAVNIARSANNKEFAMVANAIRRFFPEYKTLIENPKFRFLDGKPYLLPYVWIYRAFLAVRDRRVKSVTQSILQHTITSKDIIAKQSALLDQWGL